MSNTVTLITAGAAALVIATASGPAASADEVRNIVLVHGAWADGAGWKSVYDILKKDGYNVSVVQNPLTSFTDDVAAVDRVLNRQDGPVILVGHSYGGAVITEAGDDDKVVGLVYVEAFVPDVGESTFSLLPKDGPQPPIEVSADGFAFFNMDAYVVAFADSVDQQTVAFMAVSQIPISIEKAGSAPVTVASWKTKPSWYQVADADHIIPTDAQRLMAGRAGSTVAEVPGGHLAFIANAQATADFIEQAAAGIGPVN